MHLGAHGFVHPELIDPETEQAIELADGATGELVLTHLRHRAAPLLRFRTRDHVEVKTSPCPCGRTGPRIRCIGRTDDMLIVRGVNVFPSRRPRGRRRVRARRERQHRRAPAATGVKQEPPLPVTVELAGRSRRRPGARRLDLGPPARRTHRADHASSSSRGAACHGANTSPDSSSTRKRVDAQAPEPGGPPHHDRRRRPADVDRLLGGRARDAVRLRAAEPRQRGREPPLLRSGRRPPDHDLHRREPRRPIRPARRPTPAASTTSRSRSRRSRSPRPSSGSTSAASSTAASRTAASWTRSTSRTRSGC